MGCNGGEGSVGGWDWLREKLVERKRENAACVLEFTHKKIRHHFNQDWLIKTIKGLWTDKIVAMIINNWQ